jgi:protein O-mannosyl-transferase
MSKGQPPKRTAKQKTAQVTATIAPGKPITAIDKIIHFISNRRIQILLIFAITIAFYGNSINNDFAFDDGEFYLANRFVQKGVEGIYDLFTKESMYGFYGHASLVSGGRWRPLSLITFAIEKEYLGADPHVSHFINMLLLAITGVIMLLFLRQYIFKQSPVAAFMVVVLFIIHPIHTEAVSHIKSRDELLSWLFLLLTLYCSLNFLTKRNYWQLVFSLIFYFLGLLSKENGISFIAILPLTFYFFTREKLRTIALTTLPFIVVLGIYVLMRISIVPVMANAGADVLNAPYLYATPIQHMATALMLLGKYMLLLFWPNPLSCDYSYNQFPYVSFSDWRVWLSTLIQAALVVYALLKLKEKNVVSYGILFYFCSIFIVSNIVIDVGTFIGERFLYQPSFGFCLAIVAAGNEIIQKINFKTAGQKFSVISAIIIAVVVLSGFQTRQRNTEWNNDRLLWSTDVKKVPNSLLAHENLGNDFLNDGKTAPTPQQRNYDFNIALGEFDTAVKILPKYAITWFNLGYLYIQMGNNNEGEKAYLKCIDVDSAFSRAYDGLGSIYFNKNNYGQALIYFKKCVQLDSIDADDYGNIGACYQMLGQNEKAILYDKKALSLNSKMQNVRQNMVSVEKQMKNKQ